MLLVVDGGNFQLRLPEGPDDQVGDGEEVDCTI